VRPARVLLDITDHRECFDSRGLCLTVRRAIITQLYFTAVVIHHKNGGLVASLLCPRDPVPDKLIHLRPQGDRLSDWALPLWLLFHPLAFHEHLEVEYGVVFAELAPDWDVDQAFQAVLAE
jgi:hypothetical protein